MPVVLRLARFGRRHKPFYRIHVADSRAPVKGKFIENVGTWNPLPNGRGYKDLRLNPGRIKYWLGVGAQPSKTMHRLLAIAGILPRPVLPNLEEFQEHQRDLKYSVTLQGVPNSIPQRGLKEYMEKNFGPVKDITTFPETEHAVDVILDFEQREDESKFMEQETDEATSERFRHLSFRVNWAQQNPEQYEASAHPNQKPLEETTVRLLNYRAKDRCSVEGVSDDVHEEDVAAEICDYLADDDAVDFVKHGSKRGRMMVKFASVAIKEKFKTNEASKEVMLKRFASHEQRVIRFPKHNMPCLQGLHPEPTDGSLVESLSKLLPGLTSITTIPSTVTAPYTTNTVKIVMEEDAVSLREAVQQGVSVEVGWTPKSLLSSMVPSHSAEAEEGQVDEESTEAAPSEEADEVKEEETQHTEQATFTLSMRDVDDLSYLRPQSRTMFVS